MTDDVRLRERLDGDDDVLYRAQTDLDVWEQRSARRPRAVGREEFRVKLAERAPDENAVEFVVEAAGRAVGRCELFGADPLAQHAEIGISLVTEARGQGLGTAALRQLVEFGFERWNLHRVHLIVVAGNQVARACYRKVGFLEEGRRREHVWIRGQWDDEVLMGLLREDWRASR